MNTIRFHRLLLPIAAALAGFAAAPAMAYTLAPSAGFVTSTFGAVTFATFDGSTPVDPAYATLTGGAINAGANPGTGSNWLFADEFGSAGKVTITFNPLIGLQSYFGLYWGANDGVFNEVRLFNGSTLLGTVKGVGDPFAGTGSPNGYWNITAGLGEAFDKVELGGCCFEVDNLAVMAVPEPSSWALMALGVPLLVGAMRRRKAGF